MAKASHDPVAAALGGASKKLPWWVKVGVIAVAELVLWATTLDLSLFLVLSIGVAVIGWVCFLDVGNILLTILVAVVTTLFVGTAWGGPMKTVANGVKSFGDTGTQSVGDLDIQLPTSGPTTVPPAPAPPTTAKP